jgi:hypothetical protein
MGSLSIFLSIELSLAVLAPADVNSLLLVVEAAAAADDVGLDGMSPLPIRLRYSDGTSGLCFKLLSSELWLLLVLSASCLFLGSKPSVLELLTSGKS